MTLRAIRGSFAPPLKPADGADIQTSGGTRVYRVRVRAMTAWRNLDEDFKVMEALTDEAFDSWEESLKKRQ